MIRAMMRLLAALLMPLAMAQGADELVYGDEVNGLQFAIQQAPDGTLHLHLRNRGPESANLEESFAWILLAQSRDVAYYSKKLKFSSPDTLKADESTSIQLTPASASLHAYERGAKVVGGYPQIAKPKAIAWNELPASIRAQGIAYVKLAGERVTVKSRAVAIMPQLEAPGDATADYAQLIEQFRRDAFAAKAAHDRAVTIGADALPALKAAMADRTMPDFGSMWIATAIIHIGGADAEAIVTGLVGDSREGVRYVAAYYGPTMKSKAIDEALLGAAERSTDQLFTAWAARGFAEHGREFPPGLVEAAFASSEPRARAEIAHVLARRGDLGKLAKLCTDQDELVRVAAADAIAANSRRDPAIIEAMLQALEMPGDAARTRMVEAAGRLAGEAWSYDQSASEQQQAQQRQQIRTKLLPSGRD